MIQDKKCVLVRVVNEEIGLIEPNFAQVLNAEFNNGNVEYQNEGMPVQFSQSNKNAPQNKVSYNSDENTPDEVPEEDVEGVPKVMPQYNAFQNQKAGNTVNIKKDSDGELEFQKANTNFEELDQQVIDV